MSRAFYDRPEWHKLRYRVLLKYGSRCMNCKRDKDEGAIIQCDHIMPISSHPELALVEDNIQVLCRECNMGKSNIYTHDFRPRALPKPNRSARSQDEIELDRLVSGIKEQMLIAEKNGDNQEVDRLMRIYMDAQRELKLGIDSRVLLRKTVIAILSDQFGDAT